MTAHDSEVIVIGAGLAGLVAARELLRAGVGVEVLEARDPVGGHTLSATLDGQTVDLGGQWMGDRHARLRKLAQELGVEAFPQHARGIKRLLTRDGRLRTFSGFVPKIGLFGVLDLALALSRLDRPSDKEPGSGKVAACGSHLVAITMYCSGSIVADRDAVSPAARSSATI